MRLPEQTQLRAPSADTFRLSSTLESSDVVDVVVLCSCLGLFALYHLWYYTKWRRGSACAPPCGQELLQGDLWSTSVNARGLWIVAASLLVMAQAQILGRLLQIVTNPSKFEMSPSDFDKGRQPFISHEAKISLSLGALFLSLLVLVQCARLAVHLGFLIRVAPEHPRAAVLVRNQAIAMTCRASLYFSLGLRFFYLFIQLCMWRLGNLALALTTLGLVAALFFFDQVPVDPNYEDIAQTLQAERGEVNEQAPLRIAVGEDPEETSHVYRRSPKAQQ
ncbi:hypothetical protein N2152v2_008021 [Parachlorella kessleri]